MIYVRPDSPLALTRARAALHAAHVAVDVAHLHGAPSPPPGTLVRATEQAVDDVYDEGHALTMRGATRIGAHLGALWAGHGERRSLDYANAVAESDDWTALRAAPPDPYDPSARILPPRSFFADAQAWEDEAGRRRAATPEHVLPTFEERMALLRTLNDRAQ